MGKCGWLRNRHKWEYRSEAHRVCSKCGQTEHKRVEMSYAGGTHHVWWEAIPFERWRKELELYGIKENLTEEESRERALEWLKSGEGEKRRSDVI